MPKRGNQLVESSLSLYTFGTMKLMSTVPALNIELADAFLDTLKASPGTAQAYKYGLRRLAIFITETQYLDSHYLNGTIPIALLRDDLLLKFYTYLCDKDYQGQTIIGYLAATKRFLMWLDASDRLPEGFYLSKAINRLKATQGNRHFAKVAREADPNLPRIIDYYDSMPLPDDRLGRLKILRARAVVHTFYASAGRASEIASLTREKVLDGKRSVVRITGKGDRDRMLLLTKEAQKAIAEYCRERKDNHPGLFISHGRGSGKSLTRSTLWAIVKYAANELGLYKGTSPHSFRHFRAQQLLDEGMDIEVLQSYLGHESISITRFYYAPYTSLKKIREQLEKFGKGAHEAVADQGRK